MNDPTRARRRWAVLPLLAAALIGGGAGSLSGVCGPFTDVLNDSFCFSVLEIFYLGITTGTTPTTYDPNGTVSRLQMAAFLSRTVDGSLKRHSSRLLLEQLWTPKNAGVLALTTVGSIPILSAFDGGDIWVAGSNDGSVTRVRSANGDVLGTWTGATEANGVLSALGRILVTGFSSPGALYAIDPQGPAGAVTTVASNLGASPLGIAFDGARVWTANVGAPGSVSIVTPTPAIPWTVTTVATGFTEPYGVLYDGTNIWVTDQSVLKLFRLGAAGEILQTVTVGGGPRYAVFDGANIWVPNIASSSVSVVRASNGTLLETLTGNGLDHPVQAAFDGERILVTNTVGNSVSLWKAADLTALGTSSTGSPSNPWGASSDGVNFFVSLSSQAKLARF